MDKKINKIVNDSYSQIHGFLQRLYAINVIREFSYLDSSIREEGLELSSKYFDELMESDVYKRYFSLNNLTLIDVCDNFFPEFLDGSFDPLSLSREQREVSKFIFTSSDIYKNSSSEYKNGLNNIMRQYRSKDSFKEIAMDPKLQLLLFM